jgi:hypothetical protein
MSEGMPQRAIEIRATLTPSERLRDGLGKLLDGSKISYSERNRLQGSFVLKSYRRHLIDETVFRMDYEHSESMVKEAEKAFKGLPARTAFAFEAIAAEQTEQESRDAPGPFRLELTAAPNQLGLLVANKALSEIHIPSIQPQPRPHEAPRLFSVELPRDKMVSMYNWHEVFHSIMDLDAQLRDESHPGMFLAYPKTIEIREVAVPIHEPQDAA